MMITAHLRWKGNHMSKISAIKTLREATLVPDPSGKTGGTCLGLKEAKELVESFRIFPAKVSQKSIEGLKAHFDVSDTVNDLEVKIRDLAVEAINLEDYKTARSLIDILQSKP